MPRFIVMTASAKMPMSVKHPYRRVAVVETDLPPPQAPKMISTRARGLIRIVATWEDCHVGQTDKGAFQKAVVEAQALAAKLNKGA